MKVGGVMVQLVDPLLPLPEHATLGLVPVGDGIRVAVLDVNPPDARTALQIVHGFTGSKEDFWQVAALLGSAGIRVVAHDHRGQAQSDHADPSTYTLERLASDAREVARVLGLSRPHLLGHSFGGLVAREAAIQNPAAYSSITLFCSGPGRVDPMVDSLQQTIDLVDGRTMADVWQYVASHADEDLPITVGEDPDGVYEARWCSSDSRSVVAQARILMSEPDRTRELADTGLPANVVYGELDDAWPIAQQDEMATALGCRPRVLAGLGHCANEEDPAATAALLRELIVG